MSGRGRARAGISILETVIALALGAFALHLALMTVQRTRSAQVALTARMDALVSLRLGRYVTRRELRHGVPDRDWWVDGDSLALRAFRGTALVCAPDGVSDEITVSFRGDRLPEPDKDSVLLVQADGSALVARLTGWSTGTSPCGTGMGEVQSWRLDRPVPTYTVLARLFERGSYHLSGSALRYRRGASGRQPLTPEVWAMPTTGWTHTSERVAVTFAPADAAARTRIWSGFLAWRSVP